LIIAEKGISVSNIVNGTTRLQPCVLLTGQAAGTLAALSSKQNIAPKKIPVRAVQNELLKAKAYLMPYIDVTPENPHWEAVQKIGATGILKGTGIPHKWANQTWFYPDSLVNTKELVSSLNEFKKYEYIFASQNITTNDVAALLIKMQAWKNKQALSRLQMIEFLKTNWPVWSLKKFDVERPVTRLELAVLLNNTIDPFSMKAVNYNGVFVN
jgi:hypothetical protein